MKRYEKVAVVDFGGHNAQAIARQARELGVYCEVYPRKIDAGVKETLKGIFVTADPAHEITEKIKEELTALCDLQIPVLAVGCATEILVAALGGEIDCNGQSKQDQAVQISSQNSLILDGVADCVYPFESENSIIKLPEGFRGIAQTSQGHIVAIENKNRKIFGLQFRPKIDIGSRSGNAFRNFLYGVCCCSGGWDVNEFVQQAIEDIRRQVGSKKVLCGLSGGVDSSVSALLVHRAIGDQLTCIFVDHGLLRKNEGDMVEEVFKRQFEMNLIRVNAQDRFLSRLAGIEEPEQKRKIIGEEFVRVFEEESNKLGKMEFLCQGTIYPDIIESGVGDAKVVKSHHNVGGLPEDMQFEGLVEPLRYLFKDEVRKAGAALGIPEELVMRQPFPGPGLAVRVIGEVNEAKLSLLREADAIFREEVLNADLGRQVNQYFAILTANRSVGVSQNARTYGATVALRAVATSDFMQANWAKLPYEVLEKASSRITREVPGINRVVYDITSKPPATIEWE